MSSENKHNSPVPQEGGSPWLQRKHKSLVCHCSSSPSVQARKLLTHRHSLFYYSKSNIYSHSIHYSSCSHERLNDTMVLLSCKTVIVNYIVSKINEETILAKCRVKFVSFTERKDIRVFCLDCKNNFIDNKFS